MSSPFIGLQVKVTLRSAPEAAIKAKIISIDQVTNIVTIQKENGSRSAIARSDIASLTAYEAPRLDKTKAAAASHIPAQAPVKSVSEKPPPVVSAPTDVSSKASNKTVPATTPAFIDPAIMSFTRSNDSSTPVPSSSPAVPLSELDSPRLPPSALSGVAHGNNLSRSSTPTHSPRPKAAALTSKTSKKKAANAIPRVSSPAAGLAKPHSAAAAAASSDDFDFGAGLAAFDKKKIWDEIRSSDNTDPASLLVSHNRISNGPTPLIRGPNGVGPANSTTTQQGRGRSSQRDGQQKMRPNEMVCSPDRSESDASLEAAIPAPEDSKQTSAPSPARTAADPPKSTYEELEKLVQSLQAELTLARRRNALLEELAGLGREVTPKDDGMHVQLPKVQDVVESVPTTPRSTQSGSREHLTPLPTLQSIPSHSESQNASVSESFSLDPKPTQTDIAVGSPKEEAQFGHIADAPVLTLLFPTAAIQHAALARMEAFYESDSSSKRYLTLDQAKEERICRNYQGFNFPVLQGVKLWLAAMHAYVVANDATVTGKFWWERQCSPEELQLLELLFELGGIQKEEGHPGCGPSQNDTGITYVISSIASQANSTLPHELLHALYFLSPSYRSFVTTQWASLTPQVKKVIENDLSLRKYSPSVYEDEFQAYLAEGLSTEKEFGNKPAAECKQIGQLLRQQAQLEWEQLGYNLQGKESLWEDAKWETLDRFAARQKAIKKSTKGAASAKKAKK